ncbi:hypothetical protein Zmor_007041 [Zophobas morio]|uniref:Methuselah N-terminal domain-containing protein n=1 Tax=Zophobas morio TaxID=2755281 RepID=A0AA38MN77_9CUCU|nr:hypothetical protein Zmor_007041 [Zophobas morio]
MSVFYVLLAFVYVCRGQSDTVPCPKVLAINITGGTTDRNNSITKDGIVFEKNNYFVSNKTTFGCVCNIMPCIRKCCRAEQKMVNRRCGPRNNASMSFLIYDGIVATNITPYYEHFHLVYSKKCKRTKALINPYKDLRDTFYVQANGTLFLPHFTRKLRRPEEYCIEVFDVAGYEMKDVLSVILCLSDADLVTPPVHRLICTGRFYDV